MKLVVISDVHGKDYTIDKFSRIEGDLLVICGDITHMGSPENYELYFIEKIKDRYRKILAVPGNCDTPQVLKNLEKLKVSVHKRNCLFDGLSFSGLGGSDPSTFNMGIVFTEQDVKSLSGDVWILHQPPYMHLDLISAGRNVGNIWLAEQVKKRKPILVLSGHIHEARGFEEGETTFVNPGPLRDGYYAIVELERKKIIRVELSKIE